MVSANLTVWIVGVCVCVWGACKGVRVNLERMGSECDWGALCKIPKY